MKEERRSESVEIKVLGMQKTTPNTVFASETQPAGGGQRPTCLARSDSK